MTLTEAARQLFSKIEVLKDLEPKVRELMRVHEQKRELWFPAELLEAKPGESPEEHLKTLRERAAGIPDSARAAPEVLKTIVRERDNKAGVYATVIRGGPLAVGQPVFFVPAAR